MAKRADSSKEAATTKAPADDEVTYFFVIQKTEKGIVATDEVLRREQQRVTEVVTTEGGRCELFSSYGTYDYVSRVTGVSPAGAHRVAQEIERGRNVRATMLPAFRIFK